MKKLFSFVLALLLLTATVGAVDLYVDTNLVETDTPPTVVDGRTLVPVRAIFEAIGATVEWNNDTRTATGIRDDVTVVIQIDNAIAYVNGEARTLDVPAQIINGRTMVPARFISEAMGCDVTWYQQTQTVGVANALKGQQIYVTATGEKYHYDGSCNGGTYYPATLAEAMGRGLTPCDKCVLSGSTTVPNMTSVPGTVPARLEDQQTVQTGVPETSPAGSSTSVGNNTPQVNPGDANNFNTYDNPDQQKTDSQWVLNTKSMKIHYPTCREVKKIAPQNYSVSNLSEAELKAQGYTTCGVCH